jgi:hypothetical protein
MDWIDVAQDRDQWSALLKTVLNVRVPPIYVVISLVSLFDCWVVG